MNERKKIGDYLLCNKTSSLEQIKEFSKNAIPILNKLERQIEISTKLDVSFQPRLFLPKLKIMFHTYELLIICKVFVTLELNQYCEILELQQLGKFVFKIFFQIMNVLESLLHRHLTLQENFKKEKHQMEKMINDKIEQKSGENKKRQEKDENYYAQMEHKRFQVHQIEKELKKIQNTNANLNQTLNQNIKKSLQKALMIESSNAQFIIQESCLLIESKYNSLLDLMQIMKNKMVVQERCHVKKSSEELFGNIRIQNYESDRGKKFIQKMIEIVKKLSYIHEKKKKQNLRSISIQTELKQQQKNNKNERKKKQLQNLKQQQQIDKLKQQLKFSKIKNSTLEQILLENSQKLQFQIKKQKINTIKLNQQRRSISSPKPPRQSQFTINFESQFNSNKITNPLERNFSEFDATSYIQSKKSFSKIDRNKKPVKKMSGIQLGIGIKNESIPRKSEFSKNKISMKIQNVIQLSLRPTKITQIKQLQVNSQKDQIFYIEAYTQTGGWRNQGLKKKPKNQKVVKFKNQYQICHQFQFSIIFNQAEVKNEALSYCEQTQMNERKVKFKQIKMSQNKGNIGYSNIPRRKKGLISWSKNINSLIQEQNYNQPNSIRQIIPSSSLFNQQSTPQFSQISIQCLGFNKSNKKQRELREQERFYIKTNFSVLKGLQLDIKDLEDLFLTTQKAKNYEYLNYHIPNKKNDNSFEGKSKRFISLHRSLQDTHLKKNNFRSKSYTSNYHPRLKANSDLLVNQIVRCLKGIKHLNHDKYEKIKNFLRFPFSSITKSNQSWGDLSKQEEQINTEQGRVLFNRIQKIHSRCQIDENLHLCRHLIFFLSKIGIFIYKI